MSKTSTPSAVPFLTPAGWRAALIIAVVAAPAVSLGGCVPLAIGGAAAGGYALSQERGLGDTARDTGIKTKINEKWFGYSVDMTSQLNLSVYQGEVLITGRVSNPEWRDEAGKLAWQVDGVKSVYNEVEVSDQYRLVDTARDTWIQTRLRSAITFDSKIRALNYNIEVVDSNIYLTGSARTQGELDLVTNYARNIPNVKKVVSFVRIRPGDPNGGPPADPAAPAAGSSQPAPVISPGSTSPGSAPTSPASPGGQPPKVEVTPLS